MTGRRTWGIRRERLDALDRYRRGDVVYVDTEACVEVTAFNTRATAARVSHVERHGAREMVVVEIGDRALWVRCLGRPE